jgi:hypothetical protein
MLAVALLLLNPEAFQSVLSVSSGPIRAGIISGFKGDFNGISYFGSPPTCRILRNGKIARNSISKENMPTVERFLDSSVPLSKDMSKLLRLRRSPTSWGTRSDTRNQRWVLLQFGQQGFNCVQRLGADMVFHSLNIMKNHFLPNPEGAQEIWEKLVTQHDIASQSFSSRRQDQTAIFLVLQ